MKVEAWTSNLEKVILNDVHELYHGPADSKVIRFSLFLEPTSRRGPKGKELEGHLHVFTHLWEAENPAHQVAYTVYKVMDTKSLYLEFRKHLAHVATANVAKSSPNIIYTLDQATNDVITLLGAPTPCLMSSS